MLFCLLVGEVLHTGSTLQRELLTIRAVPDSVGRVTGGRKKIARNRRPITITATVPLKQMLFLGAGEFALVYASKKPMTFA